MDRINQILLTLLSNSVSECVIPLRVDPISEIDWEKIQKLAFLHGIAPIIMTEIERFPHALLPPKNILLKWIGYKTAQEQHYSRQWQLSCEYSSVLAKQNVKCLVLKGFAMASYYFSPPTRVFGDLDCFLVSSDNCKKELSFEMGNEVARKMGATVEEAGYKHTHIHYKNMLIENHRYLTNFNETKQGVLIEKTLQQLALEGNGKRMYDTNLWIPSPEFNVIFLLKHSLGDFIANDMTLRSLYDWALFLKAEQCNIDWNEMNLLLEKCKLKHFFDLMTETCMTYFGLEIHTGTLPVVSQRRLVDDMINDILNKPTIGSGQLTFWQKFPDILKRFKRQYKYRSMETESYRTLIWNTISYSSFLKRKVQLE